MARARQARMALTVVAGLAPLTACSASKPARSSSSTTISGPTTPTERGAMTLITEPDQGIAPIYSFLSGARETLDMTMYELADQPAEAILAADAARGVEVRVVLDQNLEKSNNSDAFAYLTSHGVHVVWGPTSFDAVHEKAAVVDGRSALVMTLNLTSRYYSDTRDFAVVDSQPADVNAIEAVFDADYRGSSASLSRGVDLVWSPGSERELEKLIGSARKTLVVENEEMSNRGIVSALEAAARRGVRVEVAMTDTGRYRSELNELSSAGAQVRTYPDDPSVLYIHAKAMVVDGTTAFVGSENFTTSSLQYNRELGLTTSDPAVVGPLAATLATDFDKAG